MAFKGRDPVRSKSAINYNTTEQINTITEVALFHYQIGKDITVQIAEFLQVAGIINKTLNPSQVQKPHQTENM